MLVIGLTGGICSGKSTVSDYFRKQGVPVIDADEISRQLLNAHINDENADALKQVVQCFGQDIINKEGYLDRALLRALVFSQHSSEVINKNKQQLENILHPLIYQQIQQQLKLLKEQGKHALVMVAIPLLYESANRYSFDRVLVVDCAEELQISRCLQRDKSSLAIVKNIIKEQATREQRLSIADDVIVNDVGVGELLDKTKLLHESYNKMIDNIY